MIHFNIALPSTPRSSKKCLPFRYYGQNFVLIYELYHTCYKSSSSHCVCTRVTFISTKETTFTPVGGTGILCSYFTPCSILSRNSRKHLMILSLILVCTVDNTNKIKCWLQIKSLHNLLKYCNEFARFCGSSITNNRKHRKVCRQFHEPGHANKSIRCSQ